MLTFKALLKFHIQRSQDSECGMFLSIGPKIHFLLVNIKFMKSCVFRKQGLMDNQERTLQKLKRDRQTYNGLLEINCSKGRNRLRKQC